MLYILLSGMPPFYGDNEQQIFDSVLRNKVDFETDPWPKVSAAAKVGHTPCLRQLLPPHTSNLQLADAFSIRPVSSHFRFVIGEVVLISCFYQAFCAHHGSHSGAFLLPVLCLPTLLCWAVVFPSHQDCVRRMLVRDPAKRATAAEVLAHDWIRENGVAGDNELEPEVLRRIRGFAAMNKLKKEALKVIASNLPIDEITGLKEMFHSMDKDGR